MRRMNAGMTGNKSLLSEVVYDDEPNNQKELERHPDKSAIISSAQKEV